MEPRLYMKSKFYRAFNRLFRNAAKTKEELTTVHLVSSCCKLYRYLLHRPEAVAFNVTQSRSLSHTYAVSPVFQVTSGNVSFACDVTDTAPFCQLLVLSCSNFMVITCILFYLVRHSGIVNHTAPQLPPSVGSSHYPMTI